MTTADVVGQKSHYCIKIIGSTLDDATSSSETLLGAEESENLSVREKHTLDAVAEALARMGRVKRVGLSLRDKAEFIKIWKKNRQ